MSLSIDFVYMSPREEEGDDDKEEEEKRDMLPSAVQRRGLWKAVHSSKVNIKVLK